jgi:hypothetical protein
MRKKVFLTEKQDAKKGNAVRKSQKDVSSRPAGNLADRILFLQRSIGNQAVQGLIESHARKEKGHGQPIPDVDRTFFEERFNYDFDQVHIHSGAEADKLNQALNSSAFTYSRDIFLRQGEYNAGSITGRKLLAHELTHVIQQEGGSAGRPGDSYEQEADKTAQDVVRMSVPETSRPTLFEGRVWPNPLSQKIRKHNAPFLQCFRRDLPGWGGGWLSTDDSFLTVTGGATLSGGGTRLTSLFTAANRLSFNVQPNTSYELDINSFVHGERDVPYTTTNETNSWIVRCLWNINVDGEGNRRISFIEGNQSGGTGSCPWTLRYWASHTRASIAETNPNTIRLTLILEAPSTEERWRSLHFESIAGTMVITGPPIAVGGTVPDLGGGPPGSVTYSHYLEQPLYVDINI